MENEQREVEYWRNFAKQYFEQQKPGIDRMTAQLHLDLINALLNIEELRSQLMPVLQEGLEEQRDLEFDRNEIHWKFIRNNNGLVGDFRLIRFGDNGTTEEEQGMIIVKEGQNRFSYWNKSYPNSPGGVKIFRGPNPSAARKIEDMISKLL